MTQNPIILLSVPRRIKRRENLFLALKGKFTYTIIRRKQLPSQHRQRQLWSGYNTQFTKIYLNFVFKSVSLPYNSPCSVLAKLETNVLGLAWVCCKIGKDWAHFRDFPIVAEQGNEAGNRIFCAKKTWISSYLCHKIFTAPSKCRSVSVFMTKSIIGDIIFIIYCQTGAGGLSIDGCKVNISNSGRDGLCQVIHQLEPLIW